MSETIQMLCALAIVILATISIVPWELFAGRGASRVLRWSAIPVLALAVLYELAMPASVDLRIDMILLVPVYVVAILTSIMRAIIWYCR